MSSDDDEAVRLAPSSKICASSMMGHKGGVGGTVNPPSAIVRAAELGAAWAEAVADRTCKTLRADAWPAWPPYDSATRRGRRHAARLVAAVHVHIAHPDRDPAAHSLAARARKRVAAVALIRLCYDAARTRYAELAAWRYR